MKFLCLPGRYTDAETMKAQMLPLQNSMKDDGVEFLFAQGPFTRSPGEAHGAYFGSSPNCSWYAPDIGPEEERKLFLNEFHLNRTKEMAISLLGRLTTAIPPASFQISLKTVFDILDREGDIMGILGFSEGASMAVSVLLEERRREREMGYKPRIECAVLMSGTPPIQEWDGRMELVLDLDEPIAIPSLHLLCSTDPFVYGNMLLLGLFDPENATLFDHGSGHLIPRESRSVQDLRAEILTLIAQGSIASRSSDLQS